VRRYAYGTRDLLAPVRVRKKVLAKMLASHDGECSKAAEQACCCQMADSVK